MTKEKVASKALPPEKMAGAVRYSIPHIVFRSEVCQNDSRRPLYLVEGKSLRVEEYASHMLTNAGWSVFKGDDAHLFFSVLSCNFKDSFFREVCGNWIGASAEERIVQINTAVKDSLASGKLQAGLIEEAEDMLLKYYASYPPKQVIYNVLSKHVRSMDHCLLLRLIAFYRRSGYKTKGAPDLFAVSGGSYWFIEVKSESDSLSAAQYEFFEGYLTSVGQNILVLRVISDVSASCK